MDQHILIRRRPRNATASRGTTRPEPFPTKEAVLHLKISIAEIDHDVNRTPTPTPQPIAVMLEQPARYSVAEVVLRFTREAPSRTPIRAAISGELWSAWYSCRKI